MHDAPHEREDERPGLAEPAISTFNPERVTAIALIVIATIAAVAALWLSAALLVPLVLSVLIAFALDPFVRQLERLRIPRGIAAAVVVAGLLAVLGGTAYGLSDEVSDAAQRLPEATEKIRADLQQLRRDEPGTLDAIGKAADDIEAAASEAAGGRARPPAPPPVDLGRLREWIVVGSMSAVGWTGQLFLLVFFVYFLLASDDLFKRKFVRLAGPALGPRRVTVSMLDGIQASLERFILVTIGMNALVAGATFVAFFLYGMTYAPLWAAVGGVLNTIPYVGSAIATGLFFIAAYVQFGELEHAFIIAGMFLAITSLEGMLIKPWLIGRTARMNNVAIFAGLLFWGWVWGMWGMLLAYPILMVIKIVADHDEALRPVSELLGD
jgi:predicted PurR-regulated permease PerM